MANRKLQEPILTDRESQLLRLLALGMSDKEAAEAVGIAASKVGIYRVRIETKLRAKGMAQALVVAAACGFLDVVSLAEEIAARNVSSTASCTTMEPEAGGQYSIAEWEARITQEGHGPLGDA